MSLTERLCGPLEHVRLRFLTSGRADNHSCVGRTFLVSLECSHLVDYKGNSALWGRRLWNWKLVWRCVLFFSTCWPKIFKILAIICSSSSLHNKKWSDHALLLSCLHTFWHAIPTIFIVSFFLVYIFLRLIPVAVRPKTKNILSSGRVTKTPKNLKQHWQFSSGSKHVKVTIIAS